MSKNYYWRMLQSVGIYPGDWIASAKACMELIGTLDLCYIIKVCDLIILYALLPMGPLTEWGSAPVAPLSAALHIHQEAVDKLDLQAIVK